MCCPRATTSVFVHYFGIWKQFLNSLAAWSAVVKGSSCSTRKPEKSSLAFTTFCPNFAVTEVATKLTRSFFVVVQHPHIPYALKCPCIYWYHFLVDMQHWNCFYTQQNLQLNILLSKLKEISAGIDYEFPYERTTLDTYLTKIGFQ